MAATDRSPSIHDRPVIIASRQQPGHWEADAMLFSTAGQAILVAHERHSRLTIAVQQNSLKADPVAAALTRMLGALPAALRRSIRVDNVLCREAAAGFGQQISMRRHLSARHAI